MVRTPSVIVENPASDGASDLVSAVPAVSDFADDSAAASDLASDAAFDASDFAADAADELLELPHAARDNTIAVANKIVIIFFIIGSPVWFPFLIIKIIIHLHTGLCKRIRIFIYNHTFFTRTPLFLI